MKQGKKWYSLDNSSKIFPATTSDGRKNTFFLSAVLKEEVNKEILEQAVNEVLKRFPSFCVRLKRGMFWYYLEENTKPFKLTEENANFLETFDEKENNNYLFKVSAFEKKITITFFHAITDGNGGIEFLKALVFEYLLLLGKPVKREGIIKNLEAPALNSETEDTSVLVSSTDKNVKLPKDKKAFRTSGTPFEYDGQGVIIGSIKVDELKEVTKKYNVTITCYLTAVLIYSIYQAFIQNKKQSISLKKNNKNVVVFIPVNMRKVFGGETLRNFLGYIRLNHDFNIEVSFEEILNSCKKQMKDKLTEENMKKLVSDNVKIEKNFFLRIMPLFIKDLAIRLSYSRLGDCLHTCNLSNLGSVDIPKSMKEYVEDIYFILDVGAKTKTNVSVVGYLDHINVCFARFFKETELERLFFKHFSDLGMNIKIISNYWEKRI